MQESEAVVEIYDQNGNAIDEKKRSEVDKEKDILKTVYVILFDSGNRIFMVKSKDDLWKDKWGGSCAGIVRKGESELEAAKRTIKRELGIETGLNEVGKKFCDFDGAKRFAHFFVGRADKEVKPNSADFVDFQWMDFSKVQEMIDKGEVMPSFRESFETLGIKI